jgi:hypothetical protein
MIMVQFGSSDVSAAMAGSHRQRQTQNVFGYNLYNRLVPDALQSRRRLARSGQFL